MFNQLRPSVVVAAIGVTARDAARSDDPAGEFARDQLMSAYSATRHLAVELDSYEAELAQFRAHVARRIGDAAAAGDSHDLQTASDEIASATEIASLGAALANLLARLRVDDSPSAAALRTDLQAQLRQLADREVDLLADALS